MRDIDHALVLAQEEIVRVSRELGADPALVLHGGGNTSIKVRSTDITGAAVDLVLVKGSGWNLATIEAAGFAPLRRERLLDVLKVEQLSDSKMVNELRQASLTASAPTASIEALLHAYIPARVVLHSHADAIVALTNQPGGMARAAQVLGERVIVLPYIMPGFDLARLVASTELGDADAIVLANHGLFTFDDSADAALARHLSLVAAASAALGVGEWGAEESVIERSGTPVELAALRRDLSAAANRPMLLRQSASHRAQRFAQRDDLAAVTCRGTATPEHVIRTKRMPMLGTDVGKYADAYREYFDANRGSHELFALDPAPRVILDAKLGLLTAAESREAADAVHDIYLHTMDIIDAAERDAGYSSLNESSSFDIEYWELEQARLAKPGVGRDLEGEVAFVTGAASGIGRACVAALLSRGAAVVGIDLNPSVVSLFGDAAWRGVVGDVSDPAVLDQAADVAAREFGGIDILVIAAGIFPESAPIALLDDELWERSLRVNTTAVACVLRAAHPFLALAPRGGRTVFVSTKNVVAPGPGAAAYSASKTAAAQLLRVAALEWAQDGIRVNQVEPDAVFDTGIWTPELLAERAEQYGLTVEEYRTRNLLGIEVTSAAVAEAVVSLCSGFVATTGAHISVDGGNDRVI
jgi:rhamnose utilization protein RhaD (predicted bifunctional aldolase and dehydrogenase)/NAD(P)-dependent dehydrogenase (short-subunit alcohol dehydrogenase family)